MSQKPTKLNHSRMQNPILQVIRYFILNIKILKIVAGGHGGTREQQ